MLPIIHQNINNQEINTVNARDLHKFLESGKDFSSWIKNRIEQYGFIENQDFIRFTQKGEANNATLIDYHIALDMAKELSMVERNDKGKEARQYFIECEKKAKQAPTPALPALPQNFEQALQALLDSVREKSQIEATKNAIIQEQHKQLDNKDKELDNKDVVIHAQTKEITHLKPKSELFDLLTVADEGLHFRESANILSSFGARINDKALSIKTFPEWLRACGYLMGETKIISDKGDYIYVKGEKWNQPYHKYQKFFITKTTSYRKPDGRRGMSSLTTLTIDGLICFAKKLGVDIDALNDYLVQRGYVKASD